MSEAPPVLEMRGVTKRFPTGTLANDAIDLDLRRGEIHALLGENGAGKSTLMNILYGLVTPDAGQILIDGQPVTIRDPADAIARGIGMVHQHFMLVPVLSVAENVVLGQEIVRAGQVLDLGEAANRIRLLAKKLGFDIDPSTRVDQLSVGQQQRVEILKAIYRNARILVLDEPTAVLTPQETREIFEVLRRLRAEGASVIFISHKLDEVLEIADRITVIRRGRVVGSRTPANCTEGELAELMVGRAVSLRVERGSLSMDAVCGAPLRGGFGGYRAHLPPDPRERPAAHEGVRGARPGADGARRDTVRRKSAEGRRGPRVPARPEASRARSAHTRTRRRQHRVHPQTGHRAARRGRRDPARLGRARRSARPLRPRSRDVPGPGRRDVPG